MEIGVGGIWPSTEVGPEELGTEKYNSSWVEVSSDLIARGLKRSTGCPITSRWAGSHWYAGKGTDNKKYERVGPMNALAHTAFARDITPSEGWVFPDPKDASQPLGYHVIKGWLRKAERLAKVQHLHGGLCHPFRRGWAGSCAGCYIVRATPAVRGSVTHGVSGPEGRQRHASNRKRRPQVHDPTGR